MNWFFFFNGHSGILCWKTNPSSPLHESKLSPSGAREEEWGGGAGFCGKCGGTGREEVSRENTPKAKMGGGV